MKKTKKAPSSKAHNKLQSDCFLWAWNNYPEIRGRIYAIMNNANNPVQASHMKALGFNKGIWDMVFAGKKHLIYIEFKTGEAILSKEQNIFKEKFSYPNTLFFVIRDFEEFKEVIINNL